MVVDALSRYQSRREQLLRGGASNGGAAPSGEQPETVIQPSGDVFDGQATYPRSR